MKKDFTQSAEAPEESTHEGKKQKKMTVAEKNTTNLLAVDKELKRHLAKLLLHFADPEAKTPLGVVIDDWVNLQGYTFMAFQTPKGMDHKKAGKAAIKMVEFLEDLVGLDGKAYLETGRKYPYKREVCVLFFKPARLLKTLHTLANEEGETGKKTLKHFEMADTLIQRAGRYKPLNYIPGAKLH